MDKKIYIYTGELTEEEQDKIRERVDGKHIAKVGFSKKKWVEVIPTDSTPLALYHAYFDLFDSSIHKGIIYIEGEPGIRYPIEEIPIEEKNLLKQELEYERQNFSLEDFFSEQRDRAVCIITPEETITALTWLDHGRGALQMYNVLYDEEKTMWDTPLWQIGATDRGNVVIQLCDSEYSPIWLPYKINDYQYQQLNQIIDNLQQIEEDGHYGIELAIDMDDPTTLEDAKEQLDEICLKKGIYTPPKKEASKH